MISTSRIEDSGPRSVKDSPRSRDWGLLVARIIFLSLMGLLVIGAVVGLVASQTHLTAELCLAVAVLSGDIGLLVWIVTRRKTGTHRGTHGPGIIR